jgi:hypothetical protein
MSIVMGIDQHRAQTTAERIDLPNGKIGRARCVLLIVPGCVGSWRGSLAGNRRSGWRR